MTALDPALTEWLLDTDPALRWQIERDLLDAPPEQWHATRALVATQGWGPILLAAQDADGQWAGGAFFPKDYTGEGETQPWTATTPTLSSLREWGLDAAVLDGTADLLAANARWEYEDLPYWDGEVDVCINAATLMNGTWLGADVSTIRQWFLDYQLADGGWNCEHLESGSVRSSFHSTLNAVQALLYVEQAVGGDPELAAARHRGEEYLLERRLLYRKSTGEPVGKFTTRLKSPFRWDYSILRALDHFRSASRYAGTAPDPRLAEALDLLRAKRQPDGSWLRELDDTGRTWVDVEVPLGQRSRWLTFYATRVLDRW